MPAVGGESQWCGRPGDLADDCSTDGNVEFVREQFSWVRVMELAENRGPAAAHNAGIVAAETALVLSLDSNLVVDGGWATALAGAMSQARDG
jgi:GT2 family glycosyltransferase